MYRILIVDDDPFNLEILNDLLRNEIDAEFYVAANKAKAFEILEQINVDLAIVDLMLPDGNGFEILQKIKEKDLFVPVVGISAFIDDSDTGKFDFFAPKPIVLDSFIHEVKSLLINRVSSITFYDIESFENFDLPHQNMVVWTSSCFYTDVLTILKDKRSQKNYVISIPKGIVNESFVENRITVSTYSDAIKVHDDINFCYNNNRVVFKDNNYILSYYSTNLGHFREVIGFKANDLCCVENGVLIPVDAVIFSSQIHLNYYYYDFDSERMDRLDDFFKSFRVKETGRLVSVIICERILKDMDESFLLDKVREYFSDKPVSGFVVDKLCVGDGKKIDFYGNAFAISLAY
ncbi:MAG: response regulator [Calditerrivibrio sp.]|nr:response regulator [Calditerrivibrio sp.]